MWFATQSIRYVECLHLMVVVFLVVVVVVLVGKVCGQLWRRPPGVVVINMERACGAGETWANKFGSMAHGRGT